MPRSSLQRCFSLAIVLALACVADSARADKPSRQAPSEADVAAYKQALERGAAAFDDEDYAEARREFRDAYQLHPNPVLLFNIASTFRREGDRERAIATYRKFLSLADSKDRRVRLARETIDVLEQAIRDEAAAAQRERQARQREEERARAEERARTAERRAEERASRVAVRERRARRLASLVERDRGDRARLLRRSGLALGAIGSISLALGASELLRARRAEDIVDGASSWNQREEQAYQDGQSAARRATIAGIAGAALLTTGAVTYLLGRRAGKRATLVAAPLVGAHTTGAVVGVSF